MTNKKGFSRLILAWLLMLTVSVLGFGQQTSRAPAIMVDTPTITLTTATADTTATPSTGAHTAIVQFKFGTVTGTYTTCTVQAKTTLDGTNYLNLSTAASITVTTGTTNTWTVTAKGPTSGNTSTPSTTTADGFGQLTKYTVACSGAYGTSAPVTVSVIYSPDVIASAATAAGTVAISQTGAENQVAFAAPQHVIVDSGASGGTSDTDDGTVAGAQVTGLSIGLNYYWDGSNWKRQQEGTAGVNGGGVKSIQGIASGIAVPISAASGTFASGSFASGSHASGSFASGAFSSGSIASGACASGCFAAGALADGADVTLGAKADAKSTATDTTAVTLMQVSKQISASVQTIAALAATDPCAGVAKTPKSFSISSATTTVLVAASSSNKLYGCSFNILSAGANNIAMVEDATGSCASPDAGMAGGTTAATGWNFPANSGLTLGSGAGTVLQTASTNVNVCLITSGTGQVSGTLMYVLAP